MSELVNALREVLGLDPIPSVNERVRMHEHGTVSCYREGCDCTPCCDANSASRRKYRQAAKEKRQP